MNGWRRAIGPVLLAAALVWAWTGLEMGLGRLERAWGAMTTFGSEFWPPDFSVWPFIWDGLLETVQIAVLGTFAGFVLSLPLAVASTFTLLPLWIAVPARGIAAAIRVLPVILWAAFAVIVFGLGPFAGVVAITLYTVGFLAKLQYEALEGLPRDAMEAVRAMGANRFQVAWHVALPEAANALRSQVLFMFEYNVRASTAIGLVGAGGIGQLLRLYTQQFFYYDRTMAILIVLFATVVLIDVVSLLVRRRFLEPGTARRIRWREVLLGRRPEAAP